MRKLFLCCFAIAFLCSCAQEVQKEKIPFTFTLERKLISVPVTIQGVTGNFLFDTGASSLGMDTTFAAKIAPYDSISQLRRTHSGSDFAPRSEWAAINLYTGLLKLEMGSHCFEVEEFRVGDFHKSLQIPEFDGLMGIPDSDTLNVWELNFEENYISIVPADSFHLDGDFLTLPLKKGQYGWPHTTLPVSIRTKQGVEVKSEEEYLIDIGLHSDILFLHDTKEAQTLNTKNDSAYWLPERHFWEGEINVCNRVKLDSARVYVYDDPISSKRILGLNFFKRFNVYFDLKNKLLHLKPIKKKFERIKWLKRPWGKFSSSLKNGKDIIDCIYDYKDNPAIKAGFQVGDEIISINGKLNSEYSEEDWEKLSEEEIWNYVIKRDGKLLNLTLRRNLNKQIED